MYRAPQDKKFSRRTEHIKQSYVVNPLVWLTFLVAVLAYIWL